MEFIRGVGAEYFIALHYREPELYQEEYEVNYPNYKRHRVSSGDFGFSDKGISNTSPIEFPICGGGKHYITWISIGLCPCGEGRILFTARVNSPFMGLDVWKDVIPELDTDALEITIDE